MRTSLTPYSRRLERLRQVAPTLDNAAVFRALVRLPELWTHDEYLYVRNFHEHYGFDPVQIFHPFAGDEWYFWHLLAAQRYKMTPGERSHIGRPHYAHSWQFHTMTYNAGKRSKRAKMEHVLFERGNTVPYDIENLHRRAWHWVAGYPGIGPLYSCEYGILALVEDDATILFTGNTRLSDVAVYLEHREQLRRDYEVRRWVEPQDLEVYEIDPEYEEDNRSYCFETGRLIPGSYMDRIFKRVEERIAQERHLD